MSDKPRWMRSLKPVYAQDEFEGKREELANLDRLGVRPILEALQTTGQLANTVLFFTSDNGYLYGEHRLRRKDKLYWESSEVPFFVKGPGVRRGTRTASMRRALTGSVSDSVVRHAHCPVTVVRGEPLAFATKVLLASDGSQEATLAASIAIGISARTDSELHLVYAEPHARVGHPDTEIVGLAGKLGAGLIVVGSRGLGPLKRALMGSVSDSVVHHSPVPSWLCAAR